MVNGIEIKIQEGTAILAFSGIAYIKKTVTSGTAYFEEKDLGKPAVFVVLRDGNRAFWVTDPGEMEKLWGAYRYWVEGPSNP